MEDHTTSRGQITALLRAAHAGDREAIETLYPLVYEELRVLALHQRGRWHGDLTMNATAIVHEAFIKLVDHNAVVPESRGHFLAIASKAMRHLLCNYARDKGRLKRGGGVAHIPLDEVENALSVELSDEQADEFAALDEALRRLEQANERQGKVVECRFFGGLSIEDTAMALGISPATVKRDWMLARTWLYRELQKR